MDIDVARWVLEFLLRQSIDDRLLNSLVRVLPLSNADSRLKKALLLRRIESETKNGTVSEKILGLLETIEELDYSEGVSISDSMKGAYCAVAVDCTLKFLDDRGKYFGAVRRIWRGRVWKMERFGKVVGLVSDELCGWRDDIEAAVWDPSVCENVREKNRGSDAVGAVRAYIAEAWEGMGPSFLELAAGTVSEDAMREVLGGGGSGRACDGVVGERPGSSLRDSPQGLIVSDRNKGSLRGKDAMRDVMGGGSGRTGERPASSMRDSPQGLIVGDRNKESQRGGVVPLPRRKHVGIKRPRGAKIADTEEEPDTRKSSKNYDCVPTPEVDKVKEALRTSSLELKAVVEDPLPDALRLAENIISNMARENTNQEEPSVRGHDGVVVDVPNPSVGENPEAAPASEGNHDNQSSRPRNNVPKPSLMARNSSAHTFGWDDSIEALPEGSADRESRLHLPTPKRTAVSPLEKYETTKFARRRQVKRWSTVEEDALRAGIQKFGTGRWVDILNFYRDVFDKNERTDVDLKDKWRNLIR